MKLQNLLKIYGGTALRKQFKGVKITQASTVSQGVRQSKDYANSARDSQARSRSPTAQDGPNFLTMQRISGVPDKKPHTSIETGNMNLSGGFPPQTSLEITAQIEEMQERISHLELVNEKLIEDKMEQDKLLDERSQLVDQL